MVGGDGPVVVTAATDAASGGPVNVIASPTVLRFRTETVRRHRRNIVNVAIRGSDNEARNTFCRTPCGMLMNRKGAAALISTH